MVSKYLKAIVLTLIILAFGMLAINYIDNSRVNALSEQIDDRSLDLQASQQLFLYQYVFSGDDVCRAIVARIDSQKAEAGRILSDIEESQKNRLFPDSGLLKKKFILQNVELYLLVTQAQKECGPQEIEPVLYFYPDKYYCADCAAQAQILDNVVSECSQVRVFAFPTDLEVPVIDLLKEKYRVQKYPSIVLNGKMMDSIVSEQALRSELGCKSA